MGTYLNPGTRQFQKAVDSEIFVDKTEMIQFINTVVNTNQQYISVSRPRRFGKTMAADMLCAYYDKEAESRELFENKKLAECQPINAPLNTPINTGTNGDKNRKNNKTLSWDSYLGKFDVIRIIMTDFMKESYTVNEALTRLQKLVIRDLKKKYPEIDFFDDSDLPQAMADVFSETGTAFVVIIDEWDSIFRQHHKGDVEDEKNQRTYLDFLRNWLKDKDYIALAYMTGILPIKKYGQHSALNMFIEYSMTFPRNLAPYTGFTVEEVKELCTSYGRNFEEIKDWYDGYEVSNTVPPDPNYETQKATGKSLEAHRYSLYSPFSVVNAVSTGFIKNYWNATETYRALAEYIRMNLDGLQSTVALLMDGAKVKVNTLTYQNDMMNFKSKDDVLTMLIHLGYLGYDDQTGEVFIPNKEVFEEFKTSTESEDWDAVFRSFKKSQELLKATWAGNEELVAQYVEDAHNQASNRTYNDESALSYAIRFAYYAAQRYYTIVPEFDSGKGFVDLLFIPINASEHPVLLVELKYDKNAETAIEQIKRQKYPERLEHYRGNILLVGINYDKDVDNTDKEFKHHTCKIERA